MIEFRPFRNEDPPALVALWRSLPAGSGFAQPMTADRFEQQVLSKPYFDNAGLILAVAEGQLVGFAHAAFGPSENAAGLSRRYGVTCLLAVRPGWEGRGVAQELLKRSEDYLRFRGAEVLYGGGLRPLNAFYLGLYGGSELPGILSTNLEAHNAFQGAGYREVDRCLVLEREIGGFRPPVDRNLMQLRRRFAVQKEAELRADTWWCACTEGNLDRSRLMLVARDQAHRVVCEPAPPAASVTFWPMDSPSAASQQRAAGLLDLQVSPELQRQGLATYLLGELFCHLGQQGMTRVQAQVMEHNRAALGLYRKFGFADVAAGAVYRKQESDVA